MRIPVKAFLVLIGTTGCIADKPLTEGDSCPREQPDGRVCSGVLTCAYGMNTCPDGPFTTQCTCGDGLMVCDPLAGAKLCQPVTDVIEDVVAGDASDVPADAVPVVELF